MNSLHNQLDTYDALRSGVWPLRYWPRVLFLLGLLSFGVALFMPTNAGEPRTLGQFLLLSLYLVSGTLSAMACKAMNVVQWQIAAFSTVRDARRLYDLALYLDMLPQTQFAQKYLQWGTAEEKALLKKLKSERLDAPREWDGFSGQFVAEVDLVYWPVWLLGWVLMLAVVVWFVCLFWLGPNIWGNLGAALFALVVTLVRWWVDEKLSLPLTINTTGILQNGAMLAVWAEVTDLQLRHDEFATYLTVKMPESQLNLDLSVLFGNALAIESLCYNYWMLANIPDFDEDESEEEVFGSDEH